MINASYKDKPLVVDILSASFHDNRSVQYIAGKSKKKIKALMDYSFEICYAYGKIFLSSDKTACALILFPDEKKTTLKSIWLDIKLICQCIGLRNLKKALRRESMIREIQPQTPMYYLWFIGVSPANQQAGAGSLLLEELITDSDTMNRAVYLETSTLNNLPWYKKFGFQIYHEVEIGYRLFFLRRLLC